jgi:hypothetical protein
VLDAYTASFDFHDTCFDATMKITSHLFIPSASCDEK